MDQLTLTLGLGGSLFDGRFGLAGARPAALADLPHFQLDQLDPKRSGGDLCIEACANDPQVAVHAIRHLVRMGFGTTSVRWSQLGFGRTSSTSTAQVTPRNLFGFKDGTNNVKAEDFGALRQHVWVAPGDGPDWLAGGSYLVARRIRMHIEIWDRTSLAEQELIIGRQKGSGAPPGKANEFDPTDFDLSANDGRPLVGESAHIRLASHEANGGVRILRRGYTFVDAGGRRRAPGRRAVLHRVHEGPAPAVRTPAAGAGQPGHPDGVHRAHRVRAVRRAAGCWPRRLLGRHAVRLTL